MSNWQNVPNWSDDQIECFDALGHFNTGFGVLCKGWLIIDVDPRNGGVLSFKQLCKDVPSILSCGYVVNTGRVTAASTGTLSCPKMQKPSHYCSH